MAEKTYKLEELYAKYASRLWTGVPDLFFDRVYDDERLGHFFRGRRKEYMKDHLESLLHHFVGGPKLYEGRDLHEAHKNLNIDGQDFALLCTHMRAAFDDAGISHEDAELIMARIEQERSVIVKA